MIYQDFVEPAGRFYNADCFDAMKELPDGCVDMILCDLPYGTTGNKWDTVIPFEPLWAEYWRVLKSSGAIVLSAAQPFTSALVMSQVKFFKYDWTWQKEKGTGHLNAKKQPMRDKEDILVFYRNQCNYNPQFGQGVPYDGNSKIGKTQQTSSYGVYGAEREDSDGKRYPKQVLKFNSVAQGGFHPTQKPVALFEYLIKTYSNEGELILDNCAGSGTTAVACKNTDRRWVCIEKDAGYYEKAIARL